MSVFTWEIRSLELYLWHSPLLLLSSSCGQPPPPSTSNSQHGTINSSMHHIRSRSALLTTLSHVLMLAPSCSLDNCGVLACSGPLSSWTRMGGRGGTHPRCRPPRSAAVWRLFIGAAATDSTAASNNYEHQYQHVAASLCG